MSKPCFSSKKMLSPKLDIVFQALFGDVGSEKITGRFLRSILKQEVSEVDLSQNIVLRREQEDDKLGILDIIAKVNEKEYCNIEMQLVDTGEIRERILYYWSKIYARQLKKGQKYRELEKTIVILIANFEIKGLEDLKYHTEWKIMDKETRKVILTDKFELRIIELPKIKEEEQEELIDWLLFLENPQSERVKTKMEENEELKEAVEKLQGMSEDDYMQRIADLREKAILDYNSGMDTALRKGIKKGKLETAKKMLEKGMDIDTIVEVTGLSKDEIVS
ncbi:MAG: Rpn family recombination-promoting nuclease/putative transposase [Clostridia bacterium]|nr:Rpn family recombination-promoting nuclease/putative transposase [Clostridia bacterium]